MKKLISLILTLVLLSLTSLAFAETTAEIPAPADGDNVIRVGATAIPHAQVLNDVAKPALEAAGWVLDVVEFTDYVMPNTSLEDGELDANYFQTLGYLEEQNETRGLHLVAVAGIHVEPMGLYSDKYETVEDLPDGATIAIPNDADNGSRALAFLADSGLLALAETDGLHDINDLDATITENPHNFEIVLLEAASLPHNLPDVDGAVINGNYALEAKLERALISESFTDETFARRINYLVVKEGSEESLKTEALVASLLNDEAKAYIEEVYNGAVIPAFGSSEAAE